MAKKRDSGTYPRAFRKMAVERMKSCDNIVALSEELGVHRRLLYKWRDQLEPIEDGEAPPESPARMSCGKENQRLEAAAGGEDAGGGFFQRCLAKNRGSTPEQQQTWRDGIYDQIRELMSMQGSLSIERMCQLGGGQPGRILPVAAGAEAGGRGHGGAVGDSADRRRAQAALRLPAGQRRTAASRNAGEPQACGAADARGQLAGGAAESVRGHHGFRTRAGGLSQSGQPDETDRASTSFGWPTSPTSGCIGSSCIWR